MCLFRRLLHDHLHLVMAALASAARRLVTFHVMLPGDKIEGFISAVLEEYDSFLDLRDTRVPIPLGVAGKYRLDWTGILGDGDYLMLRDSVDSQGVFFGSDKNKYKEVSLHLSSHATRVRACQTPAHIPCIRWYSSGPTSRSISGRARSDCSMPRWRRFKPRSPP